MNVVKQPVFVLGIMPRCGTNFLYNLLMFHPDCGPPSPVWEDFVVTHLDILARYSESVAGRWDASWGVDRKLQRYLDHSLGAGISCFLQERCKKERVISKTPRVENLEYFFRFFPESKLVILVRDGRSVIESGEKSFGWRPEPALHILAKAAQSISAFLLNESANQDRFRIIRYEDLWQDTENEMRELCQFLDLDIHSYNMNEALNLPVRGSSDLKTCPEATLHWDPIARSDDFDPLSRWKDWSNARHFRYNRVAGQAMEQLGYTCETVRNPGGFYSIQNLFQDAAWAFKSLIKSKYQRLKRS